MERVDILASHLHSGEDNVAPTAAHHYSSTTAAQMEDKFVSLKDCHLSSWNGSPPFPGAFVDEPKVNLYDNPIAARYPKMRMLHHTEVVDAQIIKGDSLGAKRKNMAGGGKPGFIRAGQTVKIFHDPQKVKVGMVTCGGLCPGLNSIIRELTRMLIHGYGIKQIYGFKSGYNGLSDMKTNEPVELNTEVVRNIGLEGGSILQAGRGGFEPDKIVDNLVREKFNILFVIGGDGTQFAADVLYQVVKERRLAISIVGLPKSIDNDVRMFDRTFGFESAVAAGTQVIRNAYVEARSAKCGVGIVKLMGRDSGMICRNASLASTVCDCALVPEVEFQLDDLKKQVDITLLRKQHMVIAVAEGAGQHLGESKGTKAGSDQAGHKEFFDIGVFLRDELNSHLKHPGANGREPGRCFYMDPSYIIRSVPATPSDHHYCTRMADDAVHAAMRGYSGICVGSVHNFFVMVPMELIASGKRSMTVSSSVWQATVMSTKMPASLAGLAASSLGQPQAHDKKRGSPEMFRKKKELPDGRWIDGQKASEKKPAPEPPKQAIVVDEHSLPAGSP